MVESFTARGCEVKFNFSLTAVRGADGRRGAHENGASREETGTSRDVGRGLVDAELEPIARHAGRSREPPGIVYTTTGRAERTSRERAARHGGDVLVMCRPTLSDSNE